MGSPIEAGSILAGKYRVERTIGTGGMGVVVEATDTRLERRVAIKFLLPEYAEHAEAASRFMREARAAVKIKSDHSARVIDVGTLENGSPYMVMEYLEGADLAQILERDGVLSVEDAALYIIQACEAVAEAHSHGIVHRDLKPANLFLAQQPDGSLRIKVLDFGISKVAETQKDHSLTRTSSMMGSPLYMSPEQMRSTRNVDLRTDIWALGVIFYEMITGGLPFIANSVPELSAKVLLEEHEPLSSRRPDLPLALERVVARALCKSPTDRFPSIAEFAMELLPFAPHRARHNVERITKVLAAAGLSNSRFSASQRPGPFIETGADGSMSVRTLHGHEPATLDGSRPSRSVSLADGAMPNATQVNFGQTSGPRRSGRLGLLAVLLVGVVSLGAAAALLMKGSGGAPEGSIGAAQQPALEVLPEPKPAPAQASSESEQESEPVPEVPAASASAGSQDEPAVEERASEQSVKQAAPVKRAAPVHRPPRRAARPPAKKASESTVKSEPTSISPFGEFGGRK